MSARLPALKLILIDYFITTFTALSPILTMAISDHLHTYVESVILKS